MTVKSHSNTHTDTPAEFAPPEENQALFALFLRHLPGMAYLKDTQHRYLYVNEQVRQTFAHQVPHWLGRTDDEVWPPDTARMFKDNDAKVLATGEAMQSIDPVPHEDGLHDLLSVKFPIFDEDGAPVMIGGITLDITEQERVENELRETNDALTTLIQSSPMAVFGLDRERRVTLWNPAAERIFGWTAAEIIGQPYPLGGHDPDSLAQFAESTTRVLNGETITQAEIRRQRKDGTPVDIQLSAAPWHDAQGQVTQILGMMEDITARTQAEKSLRDSQERMDAVLGSLDDVVWSADPDTHTLLYCNVPAVPKVYGRPFQDFLDDPRLWRNVVHPDDLAQREQDAQSFYGDGRGSFEYRILWPTGQVRWLNDRVRVVRDAAGRPTRIDGVTTDITDRKRAEEGLQQAERNYRGIFENAVEGIFQTDTFGRYLCANPALARIYGYESPKDLMTCVRNTATDLYVSTARREEFIHRMRAEGQVTDFESQVYRKNGTVMWISENARAVHDAGGRFLYYEGSVEDITERKAMEAERQAQLSDALERADRDPLTGLLNHRAFHRRLEQEADRATRAGTTLAIAMIDLDNFKFFNDAYGHSAGDDVLRQVAATLEHCCRSYDVLARFGGDEFALLMPGAGAEEAARLADRLRAGAREIGYRPPGHDTLIPLGLSIGIAVFPEDGEGRLEALAAADARLMRAKGGDGGEQAEELRASLTSRVQGFSMLDALVAAVDNKDRYTRRHSEDVLAYSLQIARELGLDDEALQTVQAAALLHDVGKIGVPDRVLRKPGKLTDEEFEAIKQHPAMGAVIVGAVPGLEDTLDAIRHHHERWDGGGYPFGLVGEETPLIARLMSVADAYSAMTTNRPYRQGMSPEKALTILEQGAGSQWDPDCVHAFVQVRRATHTPVASLLAER